jgi:hypothetical protein
LKRPGGVPGEGSGISERCDGGGDDDEREQRGDRLRGVPRRRCIGAEGEQRSVPLAARQADAPEAGQRRRGAEGCEGHPPRPPPEERAGRRRGHEGASLGAVEGGGAAHGVVRRGAGGVGGGHGRDGGVEVVGVEGMGRWGGLEDGREEIRSLNTRLSI